MEYTSLGRSGLKVSRLCLGTMNFGNFNDEKESFRIMDAALEAGINFFDTADNYGWATKNWGVTEQIIGKWFAQGGGRREKVVLATKVHEDMFDPNDGPNSKPGLSLYKVRRHLDASMRRLQTDHIEIYYMHHIDRRVTWDEMWEAFEVEVRRGRIDYAASSNFAGWHIAKAQAEARARRFFGLVCEQHRYNLLCRLPELELLPAVRDHGLGLLCWAPLQHGLLSRGALRPSDDERLKGFRPEVERHRGQLEAFRDLCSDLGEPEDTVALAWLLANSTVTSPIIGPSKVAHLEDSLKALEVRLSSDISARLDAIFPGPGGEAPEAYAW